MRTERGNLAAVSKVFLIKKSFIGRIAMESFNKGLNTPKMV